MKQAVERQGNGLVTVEYGKQHQEVILLLHGGGLSWWNYREAAQRLQDRYHVVLPVLDGHAGSNRDFTSIECCAKALIKYIDSAFAGHVAFIGGVSLGAQILTEMLSQRKDLCRFALIESALVIPMKWTQHLIGPMVQMSYGLVRRKWFARLQFKSLKIRDEWFDSYYRDTCCITRENMVSFMRANAAYAAPKALAQTQTCVWIAAGEKETAIMIRSARKLKEMIPQSRLKMLPAQSHETFALNHAADYAAMVNQILENTQNHALR